MIWRIISWGGHFQTNPVMTCYKQWPIITVADLILEFLDAIDFLGNRTQLNSAYAQVEIDLVKLEAQMISEGDLDEETERSENYTPSESIKETESLGRSGVSVLGTLSTNEAFFQ